MKLICFNRGTAYLLQPASTMGIRSPLVRCYGALFLTLSFLVITNGFGVRKGVIPKSPAQRNSQMAQAVQSAISSPRVPSFRLLECEFPAIEALNKLGDGSLQSAQAVDEANIAACTKLVETIAFPPFLKPPVWIVTSRTASQRFVQRVQAKWSNVHSLQQQGPVRPQPRDVFVFITPAGSADYQEAKRIATNGNTVVIVNGFAKVRWFVCLFVRSFFFLPARYRSPSVPPQRGCCRQTDHPTNSYVRSLYTVTARTTRVYPGKRPWRIFSNLSPTIHKLPAT